MSPTCVVFGDNNVVVDGAVHAAIDMSQFEEGEFLNATVLDAMLWHWTQDSDCRVAHVAPTLLHENLASLLGQDATVVRRASSMGGRIGAALNNIKDRIARVDHLLLPVNVPLSGTVKNHWILFVLCMTSTRKVVVHDSLATPATTVQKYFDAAVMPLLKFMGLGDIGYERESAEEKVVQRSGSNNCAVHVLLKALQYTGSAAPPGALNGDTARTFFRDEVLHWAGSGRDSGARPGEPTLMIVRNLADLKAVSVRRPALTEQEVKEADAQKKANQDARKTAALKRGFDQNADGSRSYQIERVLARRVVDGKDSMLIVWTGFSHEHTEWIPVENVTPAALEDFTSDGQPLRAVADLYGGLQSELRNWDAAAPGRAQLRADGSGPAGTAATDSGGFYDKHCWHTAGTFFPPANNTLTRMFAMTSQSRSLRAMAKKRPLTGDEAALAKKGAASAKKRAAPASAKDAGGAGGTAGGDTNPVKKRATGAPGLAQPALQKLDRNANDIAKMVHDDISSVAARIGDALTNRNLEEAVRAGDSLYPNKLIKRPEKATERFLARCTAAPVPAFGGTGNLTTGANGTWVYNVYCTACKTTIVLQLASGGKSIKEGAVRKHILTAAHLQNITSDAVQQAAGVRVFEQAAGGQGGRDTMGEGGFVSRVQQRAAVLAARSGMSFAAADRCLRLCQSALDDIIQVEGMFDGPGARAALTHAVSADDRAAAAVLVASDPTRFGAIAARLTTEPTAGMKDVAKMVLQLESIRKRTNRRGHNGYDGGVRQHRTTISKRISGIADFVRLEVATLIENGCPSVGFMADESQSRSQTDPCYVAIIFCTIDFLFGHHLVGQTDASNATDGVSLANQVEGVLKHGHGVQGQPETWLLDRVAFVGSDGASTMRSSRKYAGHSIRDGTTPKERGKTGTSMLATLQHSLASRRGAAHIPFTGFHCTLHIVSLSLGDIVQLLPPFVIPMVRGIVSYFKRSPRMFARLKEEGRAAREAIAAIEAELNVEPGAGAAAGVRSLKRYCPTRWVGLATTIRSVLRNWLPLRELKLSLAREGYGAPDNDDRSWGWGGVGRNPTTATSPTTTTVRRRTMMAASWSRSRGRSPSRAQKTTTSTASPSSGAGATATMTSIGSALWHRSTASVTRVTMEPIRSPTRTRRCPPRSGAYCSQTRGALQI